jgi:type IV pilus assembly protein PilA
MKKQQGFSLIELLIVVAIIAIIAAIAVPSMLQARMAANEAGAIQGCRTVGSAEVAFSAINNSNYTDVATLVARGNLDSRFSGTFSGYNYTDAAVNTQAVAPEGFGVLATPSGASSGRYEYGVNAEQVILYVRTAYGDNAPLCGTSECAENTPIGTQGGSGS